MKTSIDHEHLEEDVSRFMDITTQIQVVPRPSWCGSSGVDPVVRIIENWTKWIYFGHFRLSVIIR